MVHLQDAGLAGAAMVRAVWFCGVAFLAEAWGAGGFDGEGGHARSRGGGEGGVAVAGEGGGPGGSEDGGCV